MSSLGDLRWVEVPCALCGGDDARILAEVDRYSAPLTIRRCACSHVYLSPRPADEDLHLLYDEDYYTGDGEDGAYTYDDDRAFAETARIRAVARLERMERIHPPGRLLEVGCSFGAFLLAAGERGWKTSGIDISPYAVRSCLGRGLDVSEGTLSSTSLGTDSLDVVYLSETVEHLPDPRDTLRAAARVLHPGGFVVLGTANHDSLARFVRGRRWGYYMPGHLQYFSAGSLSRLMGEEGIEVVRRKYGDDRSLGALRAGRRAAGRPDILGSLKDVVRSLGVGGYSVGAGMVLYGRKRR